MNLQGLTEAFEENFSSLGELGAAVSVWQNGEEVLSLAAGWRTKEKDKEWTKDTLVPVWSATKAPAAVTLLVALSDAGISAASEVSEVWPELQAAKESGLTFQQLLSHQSGLSALDPDNRPDILHHSAVAKALEVQEPFWEPGSAHGYSPRMIGFLLDELVRRMHGGLSLGKFWRERIAIPLHLDFWIGDIPAAALERIALIYPPQIIQPAQEEREFYKALGVRDPESVSLAAFSSPSGMKALSDINKVEFLQAGLPALGGVGSAHALAKFYSSLVNQDCTVIPAAVRKSLAVTATNGLDQTLLLPTRFSQAGLMMDPLDENKKKARAIFGPGLHSFGQPGAGGSHAFADPENRISFGYVMNQMESGILPNQKSLRLIDQLYD